jgi:molybdopterin guanine dinucleotide-containing S/N-oxide reductase-like protein
MDTKGEKIYTSMLGDQAGGTPVFVHVKDGRIIRVRSMIFEEDEAKPWSIKAGGKIFTPPKRAYGGPWDMSIRRRVYNPERVRYPLKRVGYQPGGKGSTENRGKGEFVRISWDEAMDLAVGELRRMKETYGNSAIFSVASGHASTGFMNGHAVTRRALRFWGGTTNMVRNPDSWEGWYWGAEHVWGFDWSCGIGTWMDLLEDTMQNSDMSIFWSYDLEQSGLIGGQDKAQWLLWLKELGKKMIFITPDLNYTAATKADKWIPIRPGTDAALAAAIAYVWIREGTYDEKYVNTHSVGFEKWKDYIVGREDGIPKTPEWAEVITGVRAPATRALAREWASKRVHLAMRYSGATRTPYATEWARMMVLLQTMQGLGKPGVSIHPIASAAPIDPQMQFRTTIKGHGEYSMFESVADVEGKNQVKQGIHQPLLPDAVANPPVSWYGGKIGAPTEDQFVKVTYPKPGYSEIHMIWADTVCNVTNWNHTSRWAETYRNPKIETFVAQCTFLENDALFADIVLPVCTQLEREDISYPGNVTVRTKKEAPLSEGRGSDCNNFVVVYMKKCIEPLDESKSDYEIGRLLAERLGVEKEYSEGRNEEGWIKKIFEKTMAAEHISFEDFKEKGYYVLKHPDDWVRSPWLRDFYETGTGLKTPSGKIEFYSERLAKNFPDDQERPPVPHYVAGGVTHQESLSCARAKDYPLLLESPHPRYRYHSQHETVSWLWEIPTHKVTKDGQYYEPVWMNPLDAEARGIKQSDFVRIFNDRGSVVYVAYLTERMMPGVVRAPNGYAYREFVNGKPNKMLPINVITPYKTTSKYAFGMATNAFLVQVEKWEVSPDESGTN